MVRQKSSEADQIDGMKERSNVTEFLQTQGIRLVRSTLVHSFVPIYSTVTTLDHGAGSQTAEQEVKPHPHFFLGVIPNTEFTYEHRHKIAYFVAKHGVVALTESLGCKELLHDHGITINCLCPFFTKTDMVTSDEDVLRVAVEMSGGHIMPVEKVADAFMKLLADKRTGAALCIMPNTPPFYWATKDTAKLHWLTIGARVAEKLDSKIETFGSVHTAIWALFSFIGVNLLLKLIFSLIW